MLAEIFGVDGIIVLIVVLVVLFGGAAIPKLARNLGSAKNEFEKGLKEPAAGDTAGADPSKNGNGTKDAAAKTVDDPGGANPT
ncbi:MAG: twin-arginine translocase TatA/TatE family subunit [Acidimicrobiales bacterium]